MKHPMCNRVTTFKNPYKKTRRNPSIANNRLIRTAPTKSMRVGMVTELTKALKKWLQKIMRRQEFRQSSKSRWKTRLAQKLPY